MNAPAIAANLAAWIRCTNGHMRCPQCGYVFAPEAVERHAKECFHVRSRIPAHVDVRAQLGGVIRD